MGSYIVEQSEIFACKRFFYYQCYIIIKYYSFLLSLLLSLLSFKNTVLRKVHLELKISWRFYESTNFQFRIDSVWIKCSHAVCFITLKIFFNNEKTKNRVFEDFKLMNPSLMYVISAFKNIIVLDSVTFQTWLA